MKDVLILEYLEFGTLRNLVVSVAKSGLRWPDQILWRVFECRKWRQTQANRDATTYN